MTRERLPDRRPSETADLEAKVGSGVEAVLDDACILISLLLQNGVEPAALVRTVGRLGDGTAPASVIGAIIDFLADGQTANPGARDEVER